MAQKYPTSRYPLIIDIDEIKPFVGLPDGEEQLRAYVSHKYRTHHANPDSAESAEVLKVAYEHALDQYKGLLVQEQATKPYSTVAKPNREHERNWIEVLVGVGATVVLAGAFLIIPTIATMLIVQANKIALVADKPMTGLVFGAMALAGAFSSIAYRSKLASDEARNVYDIRLIKITVGTFLLWAVIASMAAYPLDIGGDVASPNDWNTVAPTTGFKLEPPMMLLFIVTAVLDLVAAPTLHQFALDHLTPRPIKRVITDAEYVHLADDSDEMPGLVHAAKLKAASSASDIRNASMELENWRNAEGQHIERAVMLLKQFSADVEAARNAATAQVLRSQYTPTTPPKTDPPQLNGRLS